MHHFLIPATWGLLAFCSFVGWGLLIARRIAPEHRFDFGLCAGWGMCLVVIFGGILNATTLCGYSASILIVLVGCGFFAIYAPVGRRILLRRSDWPYAALIAAASFVYGASVCWRHSWNLVDDFPAYVVFPIKMLATGAAIDPFNLRRLSTFGGYAFLQSVVIPFGWPDPAFLLDIGIGSLGISLIVVCFLRKHATSPLVCTIVGIACLFLPLPRINTMCTILGTFGFLVLFRTLQSRDDLGPSRRRRMLLMAAVVGGSISTFRPIYLPAVASCILIAESIDLWNAKITRRDFALDLGLLALVGGITLLPWSLALNHAAGSLMYPLFPGNANTSVDFSSAHVSIPTMIKLVIGMLVEPAILFSLLPGLFLIAYPQRDAIALFFAAIVATILIVIGFSLCDDHNLIRYAKPMVVAAAIACFLVTYTAPKTSTVFLTGRWMSIACSLCIALSPLYVLAITEGFRSAWAVVLFFKPYDVPQNYAQVQARIPRGATILTLTDFPNTFDHGRNPIYSLDLAGLASPRPGLPLGRGTDAWMRYLREQSIDFIVCQQFDSKPWRGLACRPYFEWRLSLSTDFDGLVAVDQRLSPTVLRTMADLDQIRRDRRPLIESSGMWAIPVDAPVNITFTSPVTNAIANRATQSAGSQ